MARNTAHHQRLLSKILESPFSFAYGKLPKRPSPLLAVSAGGSWDKVEHQDCDSMVLSFTFTSFTWKPWYFSRWSFGGWNSSEVGEVWTTGSVTPPVTRHGTWDPWQLSLLLLLRSFEPLRPDYNLHEFHTASGLVIHESKRKNNQTHKICMCIDMYNTVYTYTCTIPHPPTMSFSASHQHTMIPTRPGPDDRSFHPWAFPASWFAHAIPERKCVVNVGSKYILPYWFCFYSRGF